MKNTKSESRNRLVKGRFYLPETDIYLGGRHSLRVMNTDSQYKPFHLRPMVRNKSGKMVGAGNALRMSVTQLDDLIAALLDARLRISKRTLTVSHSRTEE